MTYTEFAITARNLCQLFDASVTSGIRTRQRNSLVGGADESRHQIPYGGKALDLVLDDTNRKDELAEAARKLGLFALVESDHVHVHDFP